MIDVSYHPYGKARVWLDELPPCLFKAEHIEAVNFPEREFGSIEHIMAAVEIWYDAGGKLPYGLLGVEYNAKSLGNLVVEVCCSSQLNARWPGNLAGKHDEVYVGLPPEYAAGIVDTVAQNANTSRLPAGTLRFDCAAHGLIGSSESVFRRLAGIIIQLLILPESLATEEDLARIISSTK